METHFPKNGPLADYTELLREVAAGFFTAEERAALHSKAAKLADVLKRIAEFEADGQRGRETFEKAVAAISADETLEIDARLAQLEILNEEHAKAPHRLTALHNLENQYHADFVEPANRLARHFLPRLKEQIESARATEIEVAKRFGIPLARLTGALFEPLVRAYESLFAETFGLGGAHAWLIRAGLFQPGDDHPVLAPKDEVAMGPAPKMPPPMTRRWPAPRGMGAPA